MLVIFRWCDGRETLNLEASNVSTIAYNPSRSYLSIGVQWN